MTGREKRKRRRLRAQRRRRPGSSNGATSASTRAEAEPLSKDELARERLEPLREGERPLAVTVAAVICVLLALGNMIVFAAGLEVGNSEPNALGAVSFALLMLVAAVGMWYARYWAVLGFQAILAISIVSTFLFLVVGADTVVAVVASVVILAASGTLFWFLVKSLARLQMPERRPR
jgi:hypothetical protein